MNTVAKYKVTYLFSSCLTNDVTYLETTMYLTKVHLLCPIHNRILTVLLNSTFKFNTDNNTWKKAT